MLHDFSFENNKIILNKSRTDEIISNIDSFIEGLRMRLGEETVVLAISLEGECVSLSYCSRQAATFVPDNNFFVIDTASLGYIEDPSEGTVLVESYRSGDRNVRHYGKGTLNDFFRKDTGSTESIFFRLLSEYGRNPKQVFIEQQFWQNLRDLGVEDEPERPVPPKVWALTEDFVAPFPLNQRICLYSGVERTVYTRTDTDDARDREGICEVYASFEGFVGGPCPDIEFHDTPENRALLLGALNEASFVSETKRITDNTYPVFVKTLCDGMAGIILED